MMENKEFEILIRNLDNLNRTQIRKVIKECVDCLIEMLPEQTTGGF